MPGFLKWWLILGNGVAFVYGVIAYRFLAKWSFPAPLLVWEVVALLTTGVLAYYFFRDLKEHSEGQQIEFSFGIFVVGIAFLANIASLFAAFSFVALGKSFWGIQDKTTAYMLYTGFVAISFSLFAYVDYKFAYHVTDFRKTREYMELLFFVDGPAAAAFILLLLYAFGGSVFGVNAFATDVFVGAVVMQMLLADILFVVVYSNWHWSTFCRRLAHNVGRDSEPSAPEQKGGGSGVVETAASV